jgi:hypothetical protein
MIRIPARDIETLQRNVRGYLEEASTVKERHRILLAGGRVLRTAAKRNIPKAAKRHFYYSKAGKIEIVPGNLQRSMYAFKTRQKTVEVGPRVIRKIAGKYDKIGDAPKSSSGYYAAALFRSASNFRRQVTESALSTAAARIDAAMQKALARVHKTWKKKYNL